MSGYYALLGRGPSIVEMMQAAGVTKAQRDARDFQERAFKQQKDEFKWRQEREDRAAQADLEARRRKEQETIGARASNLMRLGGRMVAAQPTLPRATMVREMLQQKIGGLPGYEGFSERIPELQREAEGPPIEGESSVQTIGSSPQDFASWLEAEAVAGGLKAPKIGAEGGGLLPGEKRAPTSKETQKQRERFLAQKSYQEYQASRASLNKVLSVPKTAMGDHALIINYLKVMDPGSVVREGEFWMVQDSGAYDDKVKDLLALVLKKKRLTDVQRADLMLTAKEDFEGRERAFTKPLKGFVDLAKRSQINPLDVVLEPEFLELAEGAKRRGIIGPREEEVIREAQVVLKNYRGEGKKKPKKKAPYRVKEIDDEFDAVLRQYNYKEEE